MMPKSQNCWVREVSQRHPLLWNGLLKHVTATVNMHMTVGLHESYVRRASVSKQEPLRAWAVKRGSIRESRVYWRL